MTMKTTIYHRDHGAAELYPIDANAAVRDHPDEWAHEPWSTNQAKAHRQAQAEALAAKAAERRADEADTANGRITKRIGIDTVY